jgi:ABC-2 type transport system permease protein
VWVIALREYRATVKTKTFLIMMGLMPVFMLGSVIVQSFMEGRVEVSDKRIGVVDHSGKMLATLQEAVRQRNEKEIFDEESGKQTEPRYQLLEVPPAPGSADEQLLELSEQIRDKELFAFIWIDRDILAGGADSSGPGLRYYSNRPTYMDIHRWLARIVTDRVTEVRFAEADIDREVVERAMRPVTIEKLGLFSRSESGEIQQAEEVDETRVFLAAIGLIMLLWMSLVVTVTPMLNSVLEEKMQRIAEVLLGSVPPFDLMLGKLIGYVLVAITLVAVYLVGGYFVADHFGYGDAVPFHLLGWFLVFQSLAIVMFGSMFLAAGSCCNDFKEAQNLVLPIWLPMIVPFFFMRTILVHPDSLFSILLSLFPPATPMLMLLRMSIPPGVPLWQPIVGVAGTLLTTLLCVWAAGRVFRVGLLMQGKPPKISDLVRWAVRG